MVFDPTSPDEHTQTNKADEATLITSIHDAVKGGNVELIEKLAQQLGHGQVDVCERGRTPLHRAALNGSTEAVKILLNYGADVNARDNFMKTPLHCASRSIALLLLDYGANVNALSTSNNSPLHYAVNTRYKNIDLARSLLERGAIVDQMGLEGTPLFVASKCNRLEYARLLISFNANVNLVCEGRSPLSVAAERGYLGMVKLLVENGATVNQSNFNQSPLHLAIEMNHSAVAKFLIQFAESMEFQGNVNTVYNGQSLLSVAAECGYLNVVKVLVENGANVNQFEYNQSPLYLAIENNHTDVAKFLIQRHAYVSLTDSRMKALATKFGGETCHQLGIHYSTVASPNDTPNDIMAAYWFSFAAELGHEAAYSPFASMLLKGRVITRSLVNADKWFRLACQVDAHHCFILGYAFLTGESGVVCDYDKAFYWLKRATESTTGSDVGGCLSLSQSTTVKLQLGNLYLNGRGTPRNYVEADRWLRQVKDKVDATASYTMGHAFTITGTDQNYETAFLWLKRAVAQTSALSPDQLITAKHELGKFYLHGNGTTKDIVEADRLLHGLSAVDAITSFTIGLAFLSQDQHQNYTKAFGWLKKALEVEPELAANNLNLARLELGKLHLHGNGTRRNLDAADKLFRQTNEVDLFSICTIGIAFCQDGASQDYEKAFHWLTKAIQSNVKLSLELSNSVKLALGELYLYGHGTSCNIVAADKWLRDVTSAIDSRTCNTVGQAFYVDGAHQNYKKAFHWLKKASVAADECVEAWMKLGILYIEGQGVNMNIKEGKAWLQKVADATGSLSYETSDGVTFTFPKDCIRMETNTVNTSASEGPSTLPIFTAFLYGNGTSWDIVAADKWLHEVTSAVDSQTFFTIGHAFYVPGKHQNYKKAFHWFKKAFEAADNCVEAWMKLGILYIEGQGVTSNLREGKAWLQKFANATGSLSYKTSERVMLTFPKDYIMMEANTVNTSVSESPSTLPIFTAFLYGNGTSWDIVAADKWLREVTTTIDSQTLYTIGHAFYVDGEHQNYKKAFHWLKKASDAEGECVEAWMKLGILYIEGKGVNMNMKEGKAWLQKVADATGSLSYETSDGVTLTFPKDYIQMEADALNTYVASEGSSIPRTFLTQSYGPRIPQSFGTISHCPSIPGTFSIQSEGPSIPESFGTISDGPSIPGSFRTDSEAGTDPRNGN